MFKIIFNIGHSRNVYINSWGGGGVVNGIKMVYIFELKQIFLSVWTILNAMGTGNEGF